MKQTFSSWLSRLNLHQSIILLATLRARSISSLATSKTTTMTWANTWDNILSGGPPRWKVDDLAVKQQALARLQEFTTSSESLKILCPLAGDDPFVAHAWKAGHDVTAIDLVPAAVQAMRRQFGGSDQDDWTCTEIQDDTTVVWRHKSGRATLYVGDMMQKRPELNQAFDAVYDKDSFGALPLDLRKRYCARVAEYCKPNAIVYTEVKHKDGGRAAGPPFHVEKQDLMESTSFGTDFEHLIDLGEVYALPDLSGMKQTGHILKRK